MHSRETWIHYYFSTERHREWKIHSAVTNYDRGGLRNHKLDNSFLIFADAQDWETVFMLTDLIFCLILAKAAALYMAESCGLFGDFFLRATDYCLLIESSKLPWACCLTIDSFLFEQAKVNLAILNRKHL